MALDPAIRFILDWGHYCCSICKQIPPLRLETQNIRCLTGSMQARSRPLSKIWAVTALWHINTLDYDFCAGLQYHYREGNGTPLQYFCLENPMDRGAWWAAVHGVAKSGTWLSIFTFTFHFHALEKEMATHSSVLAWRILGTGEPGGLPSMGSHRLGHDWSDLAAAATAVHYAVQLLSSSASVRHWRGCNRTQG